MRKNLTRTADPLRDAAQHPFHIEILYQRKCTDMKKYEKAQMEVIEFETEDVITTSGKCTIEGFEDCVGFGTNDPNYPGEGL